MRMKFWDMLAIWFEFKESNGKLNVVWGTPKKNLPAKDSRLVPKPMFTPGPRAAAETNIAGA